MRAEPGLWDSEVVPGQNQCRSMYLNKQNTHLQIFLRIAFVNKHLEEFTCVTSLWIFVFLWAQAFLLTGRPPFHPVMFAWINRNAQCLKFTWGFESLCSHTRASVLVCLVLWICLCCLYNEYYRIAFALEGDMTLQRLVCSVSVRTEFYTSGGIRDFVVLVQICVAFMMSAYYSGNKRGICSWFDTMCLLKKPTTSS